MAFQSRLSNVSVLTKLKTIFQSLFLSSLVFIIVSCSSNSAVEQITYEHWAFFPTEKAEEVDVFFVCPTVYFGSADSLNLFYNDSLTIRNFIGAINMEKGIYDSEANFYAPIYRQASMYSYMERMYNEISPVAAVNASFDTAFSDIKKAFSAYIKSSSKPFVLAGFSQGGEMILRLLKEEFAGSKYKDRFIAAYIIGWRLSPEDTLKYPHLKPAKAEDDIGVIITLSSEAESIQKSIFVPNKTISINPLNWRTDSEIADKSFNIGAVFTDYSGGLVEEIPNLCGAYLCPERGTVKVLDISPAQYPPILDFLQPGEYHIYDYLFFYRNLQQNVSKRINRFINK